MVEGTILHIPNYEFDNGERKNKFFLLLKETDNTQLIVSLPSSQEYFPTGTKVTHGCIELEKAQQTTYCFIANTSICSDTLFSFSKDTFLHGCWINSINKLSFFQRYSVENVHYEVKGVLSKSELNAVIQCFKNSCIVKNKFKKLL